MEMACAYEGDLGVLAANDSARELILEDFIPKWTSTFGTDAFRQFLSQIESATFNILGMDNGAGWRTNTQYGYTEFLSGLDTMFFHHMSRLKHLHIQAGDPLGLDGWRSIPLALMPEDLPVLQSLKLENCYVSPELVLFVQSHAQVLRSLDLEECFSGGEGGATADNSIYWAQFFDGIYKAKPALNEFIVVSGNVSLAYYGEPDTETVQDIRRQLKDNVMLKLFDYNSMSDKYGSLHDNIEENIRQFINGDDQRAYDRLMGLIKENAAQQAGQ
jgi:hypothetical protein